MKVFVCVYVVQSAGRTCHARETNELQLNQPDRTGAWVQRLTMMASRGADT